MPGRLTVAALSAAMLASPAALRAAVDLGRAMGDLRAGLRAEAQSLRSRPAPAAPREMVLRVLTYNIWGIPLGDDEKRIGRHARYGEIGRMLAARRAAGTAPHIVAIQEAFHPRTAELAREAGYPHVRYGGKERRPGLLPSGLVVLSEFPIEAYGTVSFRECTGMDCFANKGAMHVRIAVPGLPQPIEFFNTHLNADSESPSPPPEETRRIRITQIEQIVPFMRAAVVAGAPVIFPGDFNFRPPEADYLLMGAYPLANVADQCLRGSCTGDRDPGPVWGESVDHQFYASGSEVALTPVHVEQTFKEPVDGTPLSDHVGLEAHYRLTW